MSGRQRGHTTNGTWSPAPVLEERIRDLEAENERLRAVYTAARKAVGRGLDMGKTYEIPIEDGDALEAAVGRVLNAEGERDD